MIIWNDSYLLGVEEIDAQHRNLFKHLASIEEQMRVHGTYSCLHVLYFMYSYAVDHFSLEESLMDAVAYPEAHRHKAEHECFRQAALEFHKDVKNPETIGDVVAYIKQWIVTHIADSDRRLCSHILKTRPGL